MTQKTPWILGLTGGIGSGKSAAAEHFARLGVALSDSDQIARELVEPGQPALAHIRQHFGEGILLADGRLDRAALRQRIFSDPSQRHWLEALLHPLVRDETLDRLRQAQSHYAILMSPLLVESGQHHGVQRILVVDTPEQLQLQRVTARDGVSEAQVQAILKAQASRQTRLQHADDVLLNDRGLDWLYSEVERLHQFYLSLKDGQP